jgi:hypothetical protein
MEIETRLLEEWKANSELFKFYEDLKQKRFAHFLTIQTAFLAFYALLAKDALANISMVSLTALVVIAIPPLIISFYFQRVDSRSRAFVDTVHASEHAILRMFWWLWIFLASMAALVHLVWHLVIGFG